jgi:protein TonB
MTTIKNWPYCLTMMACLLPAVAAGGQNAPALKPQAAQSPAARTAFVSVFNVGPGVSEPQLIPIRVHIASARECTQRVDGRVTLSFIVDSHGLARELGFESATGTDLDGVAHKLVEAYRFKPAMRGAVPVAAAEQVDLGLQGCKGQVRSANGQIHSITRLIAQPVQRLSPFKLAPEDLPYALAERAGSIGAGKTLEKVSKGSGVEPPRILKSVDAVYSEQARAKKLNAVVLAKVIVDPQGMPRCARVTSPTGYGLESQALKAIRQFRFKPATKNGVAVPVMMTLEVVFRMA